MSMISDNKTKLDFLSVTPAFLMELTAQMKTYPSCPQPKCLRKVLFNEALRNYTCPVCNSYLPEPHHRYLLKLRVSDHTDSLEVVLYDEVACKLLGMASFDFTLTLPQKSTPTSSTR